jgi:hypothetical protein
MTRQLWFWVHLCAGLVLGLFVVAARGANLEPSLPPLRAQWIWRRGGDVHGYNQTVIGRRQVRLEKAQQATLRITADSFYRVFVNIVWVNDGPARAWPEHFQYDVLDVTPCLVDGPNEIRIIARYYGVGDFHRVPQQAGLLAQLDLTLAGGRTRTLVTDGDWEVAAAPAWIAKLDFSPSGFSKSLIIRHVAPVPNSPAEKVTPSENSTFCNRCFWSLENSVQSRPALRITPGSKWGRGSWLNLLWRLGGISKRSQRLPARMNGHVHAGRRGNVFALPPPLPPLQFVEMPEKPILDLSFVSAEL